MIANGLLDFSAKGNAKTAVSCLRLCRCDARRRLVANDGPGGFGLREKQGDKEAERYP